MDYQGYIISMLSYANMHASWEAVVFRELTKPQYVLPQFKKEARIQERVNICVEGCSGVFS